MDEKNKNNNIRRHGGWGSHDSPSSHSGGTPSGGWAGSTLPTGRYNFGSHPGEGSTEAGQGSPSETPEEALGEIAIDGSSEYLTPVEEPKNSKES